MGSNQADAVLFEVVIQAIATIGLIADKRFRFRLSHIEQNRIEPRRHRDDVLQDASPRAAAHTVPPWREFSAVDRAMRKATL